MSSGSLIQRASNFVFSKDGLKYVDIVLDILYPPLTLGVSVFADFGIDRLVRDTLRLLYVCFMIWNG
jgi:hypothetical protein